jgi:hypothetical protein
MEEKLTDQSEWPVETPDATSEGGWIDVRVVGLETAGGKTCLNGSVRDARMTCGGSRSAP